MSPSIKFASVAALPFTEILSALPPVSPAVQSPEAAVRRPLPSKRAHLEAVLVTLLLATAIVLFVSVYVFVVPTTAPVAPCATVALV